ncbi:sodium-coupled neutral amino acid transporter 9 [Eurytemora carolleeae]|uniref:sodium-coupled neutral amino acid transporter 9 n=1 Tax=Eurytemora carolleeae TaxID=1294199 RepID=UPI000C771AF3|nr:sodium-coupled neutral amino acid transporter 9 [Eurytemora carolleeae]|eukprot:XP_023336957.1 sodium-coupled neutral amino acid transporter 9-like [Eurytemora affinis]
MSRSERVSLLSENRGDSSSFTGLPVRRGEARYGNVGLSSGGGSWNRRLNEYARSPTSALGSSLDSGASGARRTRDKNIAPVVEEEGTERRPYHYRSQTNVTEGTPLVGQIDADPVELAHYRRYQYYTRLQNQAGVNLDLLNIPDHVVPASFYQIYLPGVQTSGKQSSIVTIFSIWNTMMGTSLLSMPWALQQAGLVMGLFMMLIISGLCLYTAYRILQVYSVQSRTVKISEFSDLCGLMLGKWAEILATIFSVLAVLGAAIVYWVLMSNFLFNTVEYIHDVATGVNITDTGVYCPSNVTENNPNIGLLEASGWTIPMEDIWGQFTTVPLFLILFLFPLVNLRSATFFTKFNSLGTVSILFILCSVLYRCYEWGIHAEFSDVSSPEFIPLFRSSFPSLSGILALGLFIHNAIITIMSNNRVQEHNGRDMSIAYFLVTATYMAIGAAFYLSFPLPKNCIEDNLLNNFLKHDGLTVAAKIFLFFQMTTVFPLIMYLLRVSVLYPIFRNVWPGLKYVLLLNTAVIAVCVMFAIFMPKIGTIIRFSGAACGMTLIFTLPVLVHLASCKRSGPVSWTSLIIHILIIVFGVANFMAQFFI